MNSLAFYTFLLEVERRLTGDELELINKEMLSAASIALCDLFDGDSGPVGLVRLVRPEA